MLIWRWFLTFLFVAAPLLEFGHLFHHLQLFQRLTRAWIFAHFDNHKMDNQPQWSWASVDTVGPEQEHVNVPYRRVGREPGTSSQEDASTTSTPSPSPQQEQPESSGTSNTQSPPPDQSSQQRFFKPRTCRICLEEVQPTTDIFDSLADRMFPSKARVRYVSEDPELGRLISPCKCKGSQKYVHEGCLQAWRRSAPLSDRNFWRCPTCNFEYRMQRLAWGRWLSSKTVAVVLTLLVFFFAVFLLGFIADPIINLWVDPVGTIVETIVDLDDGYPVENPEPGTWSFHFIKGILSLGVLGVLKTVFALGPFHWFSIRSGGIFGGRRRGTGRDRMENINMALVLIGVLTFLAVSATSRYWFGRH